MTNRAGDLIDLVENISELAVGVGELSQNLPGVSAYAQAFCNAVANTPGGYTFQLTNLGNACTPYWADRGITPPSTTPATFPGGQCVGDIYEVDTQRGSSPIGTQTVTDGGDPIEGPISNVVEEVNGSGLFDYRVPVGNGQVTVGSNFTTPQNFRVVAVRNLTNPSDPCGDSPGTPVPSPDAPPGGFGEEQDVVGPDGNNYRVTPREWNFDIDGNLDVPFSVDGNDYNLGPGGGSPEGPTGIPDLVTGPDISGGGDEGERDLPESPPGFVYVALIVRVLGITVAGFGSVGNTSPNRRTYQPLGNVSLRMRGSDAAEAYGEDTVLNTESTILAIPVEGLTIVGFRVNTVEGLSYTATPILRPIPSEE